jgi:hypothetical protein
MNILAKVCLVFIFSLFASVLLGALGIAIVFSVLFAIQEKKRKI